MDEPTPPKYLHACPVAVGAWLDEHGGLGLKSHSSLSNWRLGKNAVSRGALQRVLKKLDREETPEEVEGLVQEASGPGKTWKLCVHFSGGEEIAHCPNRGDPPPSLPRSIPSLERGSLDRPLDFEDYRQRAFERHRELKLVGFDEQVKVAIELRELYVPLEVVLDHGRAGRVIYSDAHHAKEHTEQYGQCRRLTMAEAFGRAGEYKKRGLVLLGDPGSGKTTQLRRVLLQLLADTKEGGGPLAIGLPADTLPVFLPLRNLRGETSLSAFMQRELAGPTGNASPDLAEQLIARGRLLFLFDGLDEVADQGERDRVARWLEDLLTDATSCWFLVSSRYAGYTPDIKLDASFLELHLRPLTDEQVGSFVENWYRVVEAAEARIEGREPGPGRATALLEALLELEQRGEAQLYAMTRNPLLLTAIALVHRRGAGVLPAGREALYHECTQVLLEGWRKKGKRLPVVLRAEEARRVLQPVALWMHGEDGRTQASAEELRAPVRQGFEVIGKAGLDPDELLRNIRDESGLLTGWGLDRYGFMHLGFQEYLAALELRDGATRDAALQKLATQFGQTWWQEVILLMLARGERAPLERFMRELVARPEFGKWTGSALMSRMLGQWKGEALAGLDGLVLGHPELEVRAWWRRVRGLERRVGEAIVAKRGGVELVLVPGGRFLMGSAQDEEGRWEDEGPQHEVELASFYLARTPVTNAQYREYLNANPTVAKPEYWGDQQYNQDEQPVVGVSWNDAQAYCEWAGLVLPTEAQWEYACRAGTTTRYWSGDSEEDLARVGWYDGNSDNRLHAVGEKDANAFGLYDMHGNVFEWCEDDWVDNYKGAVHREGDGLRVQPVGDGFRVVRGGFFNSGARIARSAYRNGYEPDSRNIVVGFRAAQGHPFRS